MQLDVRQINTVPISSYDVLNNKGIQHLINDQLEMSCLPAAIRLANVQYKK